jgi:two-component system, NtrC family, sensor kinase
MKGDSMTTSVPADRPRVLIADDQPEIRSFCQTVLAAEGFAFEQVADGTDAIQALAANAFDLLLLDIDMPTMTGLQVLEKLRQEPPAHPVKVLMLSGRADTLARVLSAGADDYLTKPFSPVELRCRVQALLRLKKAQDTSASLQKSLEEHMRDLEMRVHERTAEVVKTNDNLLKEVAVRRHAEDTAKCLLAENEGMLTAIPSILIGLDDEGYITRWNSLAEATFDIARGAALGQRLADCPIRWDDGKLLDLIGECRQAGKPRKIGDIAFTKGDGQQRYLGVSLAPFASRGGAAAGMLLFADDLTEHRCLQAQLNAAQKLESIGQLAAGIAHEINTPIQYVGDNTVFLKDAFADMTRAVTAYQELAASLKSGAPDAAQVADAEQRIAGCDIAYLCEEVPRAIEQTQEGLSQVARIVRAMKEFSHPGSEEKTAVDLNRAIENTITVARNEWKYVAEVVSDLDASLPQVPCLPGELNQVFLNLIVNAAHAITDNLAGQPGGKGVITVRTRGLPTGVEIRIQDTGCGIPPAIQSRVFDPFFTTKPVGKGTGQGLAIARNVVVKKHGGTIAFESEAGKGTTFIMNLPFDPTLANHSAH